MARRLNLLYNHDLLPKTHSEAFLEADETQFYRRLNQMRQAQHPNLKRLHHEVLSFKNKKEQSALSESLSPAKDAAPTATGTLTAPARTTMIVTT